MAEDSKKMGRLKILFVYESAHPVEVKDGLWAALNALDPWMDIEKLNIKENSLPNSHDYDFILGWGAFGSGADGYIRDVFSKDIKKGLCIGGINQPNDMEFYDVLFYETEWYRPIIENHPNIIHAFGINADIFYKNTGSTPKIWDVISVGAFAAWKRFHLMKEKKGERLVVGEIQKGNPRESYDIIADLLGNGVMVGDMVPAENLAKMYWCSKKVYMPADTGGGGERVVLEARACGTPVEIEDDNDKLKELLESPVWDHNYYAEQLRKGILSCLK